MAVAGNRGVRAKELQGVLSLRQEDNQSSSKFQICTEGEILKNERATGIMRGWREAEWGKDCYQASRLGFGSRVEGSGIRLQGDCGRRGERHSIGRGG